jgi:Ca2+/H+ antiporter, TMEM165/GDT1 family
LSNPEEIEMKRCWIRRGLKFLLLVVLAVAGFSVAVMLLWNWLMPALFGWTEIGFAQALGLLVLGRILFGRFGGHWGGHHMGWRHRMMERWDHMTPEEREKFRAGFRGRCGHGAPPPSATT